MQFVIRTYQRFSVHCRVNYRSNGLVGRGRVWNLSRNGWRVDGDCGILPGDKLILCVYLPSREGLLFIDRAVVRWSRGQEFGLENLRLEADNEARLIRLVTSLVQSPCYRPSWEAGQPPPSQS